MKARDSGVFAAKGNTKIMLSYDTPPRYEERARAPAGRDAAPVSVLCFAAGKGERMRPYTAAVPKPLLAPGGEPMLRTHIRAFAAAGVRHICVNGWYLPELIREETRKNRRAHPACRLTFLQENGAEPLETAGGLINALPRLTGDAFFTVNTDMLFADSASYIGCIRHMARLWRKLPDDKAGLLLLVPRAKARFYHGAGDFVPADAGGAVTRIRLRVLAESAAPCVYSGVQILPKAPFANRMPVRESLRRYYETHKGALYGLVYRREWLHIGDPGALIRSARLLRIRPESGIFTKTP